MSKSYRVVVHRGTRRRALSLPVATELQAVRAANRLLSNNPMRRVGDTATVYSEAGEPTCELAIEDDRKTREYWT